MTPDPTPAVAVDADPTNSDAAGRRRAVVLLSGGLDSATVLALAGREGFEPCALSFRHGQRHGQELEAARRVAAAAGVRRHAVVDLDLRPFGGSALTADLPVPKGRSPDEMARGIPATYVPARNTIFLSFALAWAEVLDAPDLFLGVNALDLGGYPDCRPEYIEAFERVANLATRAGVEGPARGKSALRIHTPLIALTKAQIIARGLELGVNFALTHSCYDPAPGPTPGACEACGQCDACLLRLEGFRQNGLRDPIPYARGAGAGEE